MVYLVSGGTGLIGSRVVRNLVKEGEQVIVFDWLSPEASFLPQLMSDKEMTRVKIVQSDVTDLPQLMRTIKENNVEKVIHMAYSTYFDAQANPARAIKINCEGTNNVFETARILGIKKVVCAGSIVVFGIREKDTEEEYIPNDAPLSPPSRVFGVYGACKIFDEHMAVHYFEQYGVDISVIRLCHVYGVYGGGVVRGIGHIVRELVLNPAVGKLGRVPFGDDIWNWLYVEDAARAIVLSAKATRTKTRAFNTSGDIRSMKEVADCVRKYIPGANITLLPGRFGLHYKFGTMPIKEELGFSPEWPIERGVKDMINGARQEAGLPSV